MKTQKSVSIVQIGIALAIGLFLLGLFNRDLPQLLGFRTAYIAVPDSAYQSPLFGTPFMFIPNGLVAAILIGFIGVGMLAGVALCVILLIRGK